MMRCGLILILSMSASLPVLAAGIAPDDVILKAEIEAFGVASGLQPVQMPGASGGLALAMARHDARIHGAVKLPKGKYTLFLRVHGPAGDQDACFAEVRGKRRRMHTPSIGHWHTMVITFGVAGEETVPIIIENQEIGYVVDQIALVRGHYDADDRWHIADLPGETKSGPEIKIEDLPWFVMSVRLAQAPQEPLEPNETTLLHESFDDEPAGASGTHRTVEGKFGKALYLDVPDGRFVADTSGLEFGPKGTIEFWVRPRHAQQLWSDQGWHYFLHCAPAEGPGEKAFTLDLSRHPSTQLQLTASIPGAEAAESLRVSTSSVDVNAWHHLLISWDMTGKRQHLWLLLDGVGKQLFFEPRFEPTDFQRVEIGNTPLESGLPFLFLDGALDELRISNASVAERLASHGD